MTSKLSRSSLVGKQVYDSNAKLIGSVVDLEVNLEDPSKTTVLISTSRGNVRVYVKDIKAVGDIVLLSEGAEVTEAGEVSKEVPTATAPAAPTPTPPPTPAPAPKTRPTEATQTQPVKERVVSTATSIGAKLKESTATIARKVKEAPAQVSRPTTYEAARCPNDGTYLVYYPQYGKWYCPTCRNYVNVSPEVLSKVPRCRDCGSYLSYIPQYGKWYCYNCRKYF